MLCELSDLRKGAAETCFLGVSFRRPLWTIYEARVELRLRKTRRYCSKADV